MSRDAPGGTFIDPLDAWLVSCPVSLRMSPAVCETWAAYRWYDRGALAHKYPLGIPVGLVRAVEELDAGYNSGAALRMRRDRDRAGSGRKTDVEF